MDPNKNKIRFLRKRGSLWQKNGVNDCFGSRNQIGSRRSYQGTYTETLYPACYRRTLLGGTPRRTAAPAVGKSHSSRKARWVTGGELEVRRQGHTVPGSGSHAKDFGLWTLLKNFRTFWRSFVLFCFYLFCLFRAGRLDLKRIYCHLFLLFLLLPISMATRHRSPGTRLQLGQGSVTASPRKSTDLQRPCRISVKGVFNKVLKTLLNTNILSCSRLSCRTVNKTRQSFMI